MAKKDDFDLDSADDFDFGMDDTDAGYDSPGSGNNRKPTTRVLGRVKSGLDRSLNNDAARRKFLKASLPDSYSTAIDGADQAATAIRSSYNELMEEVGPTLKEVKRTFKPAAGVLRKVKAGKLADWLEKEEYSYGEDTNQDEAEVATVLGDTFGEKLAQMQAQAQERQEEVQEKRDEIEDEDREDERSSRAVQVAQSLKQGNVLQAIRGGIDRLVSYQDQITFKVQQKQLEIQTRQFIVARKHLEVFQQFKDEAIVELKEIHKNTGLPEINKIQMDEQASRIIKERFIGKAIGFANSKAGPIGTRILQRTKGKLKDMIMDFGANITTVGDVVRDNEEMGGGGIGSMAGDMAMDAGEDWAYHRGIKWAGNKIRNKIEDNKHVRRLGLGLDNIFSNAGIRMNSAMMHGNTGYKWIDKLAGWLGSDTAIRRNDNLREAGVDKLDEAVFLDERMKKTIIDIIPGWLSKIEVNTRKGEDKEELKYDHTLGRFRKTSKIRQDVFDRVVDKKALSERNDALDNWIDELDPEPHILSNEARAYIRKWVNRKHLDGDIVNPLELYYDSAKAGKKISAELQEKLPTLLGIKSSDLDGVIDWNQKEFDNLADKHTDYSSKLKQLNRHDNTARDTKFIDYDAMLQAVKQGFGDELMQLKLAIQQRNGSIDINIPEFEKLLENVGRNKTNITGYVDEEGDVQDNLDNIQDEQERERKQGENRRWKLNDSYKNSKARLRSDEEQEQAFKAEHSEEVLGARFSFRDPKNKKEHASVLQRINRGMGGGTFAKGGYTGDEVQPDELAGVVHGQEYVTDDQATKNNRRLLEWINKLKAPLINPNGKINRLYYKLFGKKSAEEMDEVNPDQTADQSNEPKHPIQQAIDAIRATQNVSSGQTSNASVESSKDKTKRIKRESQLLDQTHVTLSDVITAIKEQNYRDELEEIAYNSINIHDYTLAIATKMGAADLIGRGIVGKVRGAMHGVLKRLDLGRRIANIPKNVSSMVRGARDLLSKQSARLGKAGDWAFTKAVQGSMWLHGKLASREGKPGLLSKAASFVGAGFNTAKGIVKDLYQRGNPKPILTWIKLKAGEYFGPDGKVLTSWKEIAKGVYDKTGALLLDVKNIAAGLYDFVGKPVLTELWQKAKRGGKSIKDRITAFKPLAVLSTIKDKALSIFQKAIDVYTVKSKDTPALTKVGFEANEYFDAESEQILKSHHGITGRVVDKDGNVLVSDSELSLGLFDAKGKRLDIPGWQKIKKLLTFKFSMPTFKGGLSAIKNFFTKMDDVYRATDLKTPVLFGNLLNDGRYFSLKTKEAIKKYDDLKEGVADDQGKVILTKEDVEKGLVDKNGSNIFAGVLTKVKSKIKNLAVTAKNMLSFNGMSFGNLFKGFQLPNFANLFDKGTSKKQLEVLMEIRDLLAKGHTENDKELIDKVEQLVENTDPEVNAVLSDPSIPSEVKDRVAPKSKRQTKKQKAAEVALAAKAKAEAKDPEDGDGDGMRDGSWQAQRAAEQREKDKADNKVSVTVNNQEGDSEKKGFIGKLAGMLTGVVGGMFAKLGAKFLKIGNWIRQAIMIKNATSAFGAGMGADGGGRGKFGIAKSLATAAVAYGGYKMLSGNSAHAAEGDDPKGTDGSNAQDETSDQMGLGEGQEQPGMLRQAYDMAGGATGIGTMVGAHYLGKKLFGGARDVAENAAGEAATRTATGTARRGMIRRGAVEAGKFIAKRAVPTVARLALQMGAGLLTTPVGLAVLAVAAAAYGGYKLYKYLKDKKIPLLRFRMEQYGFGFKDSDATSKILNLEELVSKHLVAPKDGAPTIKPSLPVDEMLKIFDINLTEEGGKSGAQKFTGWFTARFKPIFLSYVKQSAHFNNGSDISKLDEKLGKTNKLQLLENVHFKSTDVTNPYMISASPFKDKEITKSIEDVQEAYKKCKEELSALPDDKEEVKPTDAKAKDGKTSKTATNGEPAKDTDTGNSWVDSTLKGLKSMKKQAGELLDQSLDSFSEAYTNAMDKLGGMLSTKWKEFSQGAAAMWQSIKDGGGAVVDGAKEVGSNIVAAANETSTAIVDSVSTGYSKLTGKQSELQLAVFKAFKNAGLNDNQAKIITAEVGRENDYNARYLFGGHNDPANGKYNLGFISWQGDRGKNLYNFLNSKGLIKNGKIVESQAALDAQAQFAINEINTNGEYRASKEQFLANPNVDYKTGTKVLGTNYIRWRYTDAKYASHHQRRDAHYNSLNKQLSSGAESKGVSMADKYANAKQINGSPTPTNGKVNPPPSPTGQSAVVPNNGKLASVAGGPVATAKTAAPNMAGKAANATMNLVNAENVALGQKIVYCSSSGVNLKGMNKDFMTLFYSMCGEYHKATGKKIQVNSAFRTRAEQTKLYNDYVNGKRGLAAKPGTSRHETGIAIDVQQDKGADDLARLGLLSKYGFTRPLINRSEPFHIEHPGFKKGETQIADIPPTTRAKNAQKQEAQTAKASPKPVTSTTPTSTGPALKQATPTTQASPATAQAIASVAREQSSNQAAAVGDMKLTNDILTNQLDVQKDSRDLLKQILKAVTDKAPSEDKPISSAKEEAAIPAKPNFLNAGKQTALSSQFPVSMKK